MMTKGSKRGASAKGEDDDFVAEGSGSGSEEEGEQETEKAGPKKKQVLLKRERQRDCSQKAWWGSVCCTSSEGCGSEQEFDQLASAPHCLVLCPLEAYVNQFLADTS